MQDVSTWRANIGLFGGGTRFRRRGQDGADMNMTWAERLTVLWWLLGIMAIRTLSKMADRKRVAIIGAGCSGLAAIKCCVDEGLEPVCFERTDHMGGLWRYTQKVRDGQSCVMKSTVANSSKEIMCYSDFPMPKEYPNFVHNSLVWEYLKKYAEHFQLKQHIRYSTEVKRVSPTSEYQTTGRWTLQLQNHQSGDVSTEVFDAVMVCTGHHADKNVPTFPGLADFQGQVVHSHDYREPSEYVGKRAVVIGIGNSGGDMAVELSRVGQVYLSTRRGSWIMYRIGPRGIPFDILRLRRCSEVLYSLLPTPVLLWRLTSIINGRMDHDMYSLRPNHAPWAQQVTVNDDLANRIACGSVKVKTDIKRFTATGVEFVDGTFEDNIDVVFLATGYKFGFPFIDQSVVDVKENRLPLYKYMFPPDLQRPTLAVIGFFQPQGATLPVSELQCRLATRVFKGEVRLPSSPQMWEDIQAKQTAMAKRYVKSQRNTIQVDWIPFMDELAELTGCRPDLVSLLKTDPRLAFHVFFGPCTPCQYRLMGPGQWKGARDAILTTMDRVRYPLSTRPLPPSADQHHFMWVLALVLLVFLVRSIFL